MLVEAKPGRVRRLVLFLRLDPDVKAEVESLAAANRQSINVMAERMLRDQAAVLKRALVAGVPDGRP